MTVRSTLITLLALSLPLSAHAAEPEAVTRFGRSEAPYVLLARSTTDIALVAPAIESFVTRFPDHAVAYEQWGSNDLYEFERAACAVGSGAADLVISSAIDLQVKLVNDGCSQPHHSAAVAALPAERRWRDEVFGVTSEPAVIVYNRALVPSYDIPASRFDLLDLLRRPDTAYAGRVATYDIAASGLGYLFAFADSQQATTFGSLIEAFGRTGAIATCCSAEIIEGVETGRYLIAYNVLGSYALDRADDDDRLAVVLPRDYTLVLSRAALIPKHAEHPGAAGALIDFLLSTAGRAELARTHLIVDVPPDDTAQLRPIPLSPVLLVGLDQQKRALLMSRWRDTFPEE
ncbi:MAG: ABC transporter substrate-binding protein [Rhodobacteraceae bacterium]|nr:ABC transporter substrate-binding protein [Paracoccaceae bacterium]